MGDSPLKTVFKFKSESAVAAETLLPKGMVVRSLQAASAAKNMVVMSPSDQSSQMRVACSRLILGSVEHAEMSAGGNVSVL